MAEFAGGTGTENDPYLIENKEQLRNIDNHITEGSYFELIDNIDLAGEIWEPLGDTSFAGYVDGKGFEINNLKIDDTIGKYSIGLFFDLDGVGVVKNIVFNNPEIINPGAGRIGVLSGWGYNDGIENIRVYNGYLEGSNDFAVGGIVGTGPVDITNCHFEGTVINRSLAGGIIAEGMQFQTIKRCSFQGKVKGSIAAGIIADDGMNHQPATIINCYARGEIEAEYNAGGIAGTMASDNGGHIENCHAVVTIFGELKNDRKHPIIDYDGVEIINCYYDEEVLNVYATSRDGAYPKTTQEMKQQETFINWNFGKQPSEVSVNYNDGYPELKGTIGGIWWLPGFAGGTGTENDPYLIATTYHFDNIRNHVNEGAWFKQVADLDFNNEEFVPLSGNDNSDFHGKYDGQSFKIENLYIDASKYNYSVSIFGYVYSEIDYTTDPHLSLKNIIINNVSIINVGQNDNTANGILANTFETWGGSVEIKNIEINNCSIDVVGNPRGFNVSGGMIGESYLDGYTDIENCNVDITINVSDEYDRQLGGLFGNLWVYGYDIIENIVHIENCHTKINMVKQTESIIYNELVGGLIGYAGLADEGVQLIIEDCSADSKLFGRRIVGGLFGAIDIYSDDAIAVIERCYATTSITGVERDGIGSFAGALSTWYNTDQIFVKDCYAIGTISNETGDPYYIGGFVGGGSYGGPVNYKNCYAITDLSGITTIETDEIAGFILKPEISGSNEIIATNCYWNKDLVGIDVISNSLGEPRTTEEMTYDFDKNTTYVGWDFGDQPYHLDNDYNNGYPELLDTINGIWWIAGSETGGELQFIDPPKVRREMPKANRITVKSDTAEWTSTVPDTSEDNITERVIQIDEGSEKVCKQVADRLLDEWSKVQINITGDVLLLVDLEFKTKVMVDIEDSLVEQEKFILQSVKHDLANYTTTVSVGDLILDDQELLARILDDIN